jgi:hypothetical protein
VWAAPTILSAQRRRREPALASFGAVGTALLILLTTWLMADTYLNHHRHLIFLSTGMPIGAGWATAHKGAETACEMGTKLAEHRIEARFLARS